jgi:hypothetical protein
MYGYAFAMQKNLTVRRVFSDNYCIDKPRTSRLWFNADVKPSLANTQFWRKQMPVKIVKVDQLTAHGRGRKPSVADDLEEFTQVKTKLAHGLKPFEAIEVELPPSKIKTLRELFKRKVSRYVKELKLTDYEVQAYTVGGKHYVSIANMAAQPGNGDGLDREQRFSGSTSHTAQPQQENWERTVGSRLAAPVL